MTQSTALDVQATTMKLSNYGWLGYSLTLFLANSAIQTQAFVPRTTFAHSVCGTTPTGGSSSFSSPTILFYRNDTIDEARSEPHDDNYNNPQSNQYDPFREMYKQTELDPSAVLTMPVLGPIPNQGPLMLGAELTLDPPTPWQWQTIEEATWQHAKFLNRRDDQQNQAAIDAAPLVAIMDSTTSSVRQNNKGSRSGRYATIAAVVGMTTTAAGTTAGQQGLDLTDSESLIISLRNAGRDTVSPWESKIRLVGVGRALLSDCFYRMPSRHYQDGEDEQGYVTKMGVSSKVSIGLRYREEDDPDGQLQNDDGEEDDEIFDDSMNLVFAHFVLLTDGVDRTTDVQRRERNKRAMGREVAASPVHALAEMANWARKMDYLHQDRRRLVAGLQAATARLQLAGQKTVDSGFYDDFEDHDGLGLLTAYRFDANLKEERVASQAAVEDILQIPPASRAGNEGPDGATDENGSPLAEMENYGMGYSPASFSTLPQVTLRWLDTLEPFYSPQFRATEEYYYEILSFAAIKSMDKFLEDRDIGWALTCANTLERMQQAYEWLFRHVRLLEDEAAQVSARLQECGEECTDLW